MTDIDALISALPKAELHVHLEGTLEPDMLLALADRNKVDLPYETLDDVRAAYDFSNLQDFLDIYYQGMAVLQTAQDFYDLTDAYLARAAADHVVHVEAFFDPQAHTARGVPFAAAADGILNALADGRTRHGVCGKLILCFLRHLSEDEALATFEEAEPWLDRILGVGLDSSEVGHPPSKFQRVFERARAFGLKTMAHAGEEGPPDYVAEALDVLRVDRIDHGNRALEDPALVERLRRAGTTLTDCPLTNLSLCGVDDLAQHPLKRMLDLGLNATVNSDDPAYFGGYVNENYRQTAHALGLSAHDVMTLARNSVTGSFITPSEQAAHLQAIDGVAARFLR